MSLITFELARQVVRQEVAFKTRFFFYRELYETSWAASADSAVSEQNTEIILKPDKRCHDHDFCTISQLNWYISVFFWIEFGCFFKRF